MRSTECPSCLCCVARYVCGNISLFWFIVLHILHLLFFVFEQHLLHIYYKHMLLTMHVDGHRCLLGWFTVLFVFYCIFIITCDICHINQMKFMYSIISRFIHNLSCQVKSEDHEVSYRILHTDQWMNLSGIWHEASYSSTGYAVCQ